MHNVTRENVAALTDHFADALFAKTLHASITLWRRIVIRKFDADAMLVREIQAGNTKIPNSKYLT